MVDSATHRILFVDDDELIVRLTTATLRREGCDVVAFRDGRDALAAFESSPNEFDLVVADVRLGAMSGIDLAARMLTVHPHAAIVLISGLILQEDRDRAFATGVRGYLPKAKVMTDLPGLLRRWLPVAPGGG